MPPDPVAGDVPRENKNPSSPDNSPPKEQNESLGGLTENLGLEPATPDHDPLIGTTIGGVRIIRPIAEGGMGRVYEGLQDKPRRPVAVKVLRPGLVSREICRRFDNESELLGRLRHPHIAQIYSAGVCEVVGAHVPYFVMEFIPNAKPITEYVIDKKLETQQKLELFRKVCEAVAHGHEKGVIHRDLKPSNILVEPSGDPKVIDFGVARSVDTSPEQMTALTEIGQLVGTVQYMSPEQFSADPTEIDTRADVYALGVILYELLTGKPPYEIRREQIFAAAEVVRKQKPVSPSKLNRTVQPDVEKITGRCLQKDRTFRYANAAELATALGSYLGGVSVPQPRQRMGNVFAEGVGRWQDWRPAFRSVTLGLPLLGIAAAALWWFQQPNPPAEPDQLAMLKDGAEAHGELQAIFLSRLKEKDFRVAHHGFGRGLHENTPIYSLADGKLSPHGLSMHPGGGQDISYVRYELPAGARRFRSTVSIDRSGSWDHCGIGFELLADGKSIWKSPKIFRWHQSDTCDVEIHDCRTLELRTLDMGGVFGGHAVWIEPQIYVDPVAWTAQIPVPALAANDGRRGQMEKQVFGTWKDSNGYTWRFNGDGTMSIDGLGGGVWELLQDGRLLTNRSHGTANEVISITSPEKMAWPDGGSLTKLSPDTTFTAAETNFGANREAAGWVLRLKGSVDVEVPGGKRERIEAVNKLPAGDFVVVSINLPPNAGIKSKDLSLLKPLDKLEQLILGGNPVTDELFDHIGDLPRLKGLFVNWTKVTGQGLQRLTSAKLESIDCSGVQDIHRGVQRLHAMGSVRVLVFGLTDMQKNPETLKLVSEMKTLRHLQFGKDDMSPAQIQSLQQALPQCAIVK